MITRGIAFLSIAALAAVGVAVVTAPSNTNNSAIRAIDMDRIRVARLSELANRAQCDGGAFKHSDHITCLTTRATSLIGEEVEAPVGKKQSLIICCNEDGPGQHVVKLQAATEPVGACRVLDADVKTHGSFHNVKTRTFDRLETECAPCRIEPGEWGICPYCLCEPGGCAAACPQQPVVIGER